MFKKERRKGANSFIKMDESDKERVQFVPPPAMSFLDPQRWLHHLFLLVFLHITGDLSLCFDQVGISFCRGNFYINFVLKNLEIETKSILCTFVGGGYIRKHQSEPNFFVNSGDFKKLAKKPEEYFRYKKQRGSFHNIFLKKNVLAHKFD